MRHGRLRRVAPGLLCLFMVLAGWTAAVLDRRPDPLRLADAPPGEMRVLLDVPVRIQAVVVAAPRWRGDELVSDLRLERVERARVSRPSRDPVRLLCRDAMPHLREGDRIWAWVTLRAARLFVNLPSRGPFRRDLIGRLKTPRLIERIERPAPGLRELLARGRRAVRARLESGLRRGGASLRSRRLAGALTYGERAGIEETDRRALQVAGVAHILAISGLHVVILTGCLAFLLRAVRIGPGVSTLAVLAALTGYALLLPVRPSVIRATLMGLTLLAARWAGRSVDTLNLLGGVGLLCLLVAPDLRLDPGFLLSFAVTAGLIHLGPGGPSPGRGHRLRAVARASCAAAAVSTPLSAYFFGRVALAAPLANPVIVPAAAALVVLSALAAMASVVHPLLAVPIAPLLEGVADALYGTLHLAADLGLQVLPVPRRRGPLVIGTLVLLFGSRRSDRSWRPAVLAGAAAGLAALLAGLWPPQPLPAGRLSLRAIDVGQGDSLLVGLPDGRAILVDGGGLRGTTFDVGARVVVPALIDAGVSRLAAVVLSHPHHDHGAGLRSVLAEMPVDELWLAGLSSEAPLLSKLVEEAVARHVAVRVLERGDQMERGGVVVRCLHPLRRPGVPFNDRSLVLHFETADGSILLPGDLEAAGEVDLLASDLLSPVTVLKVAHHGSRTSTSTAFLAAVRPRAAIISVGASNSWGHPHDEVVARLIDSGILLRRTDRDGAVTVGLQRGTPLVQHVGILDISRWRSLPSR